MLKRNLLVKILYIALQGVFLPLILWVDDLRGTIGFYPAFGLYEALVIGDALLYWKVFQIEK